MRNIGFGLALPRMMGYDCIMEITKFDILTKRAADLKIAAEQAEYELAGLQDTPCGLPCAACGETLETEADFAKHFVIQKMDRINGNLNLGECPNTERGRIIIANAS